MVGRTLSVLVVVSAMCVGCGGGGSSNGGTVTPTSDESPGVDATGNLTGEIWVTDRFGTERINLQTGKSVEVSEENAYPSRDGRVFVEHIDEAEITEDIHCSLSFATLREINVKDSLTGAVLSSFRIDREINGPVRMSPDRERFAMYVAEDAMDCGSNIFNSQFSVFSKDGEELYRNPLEDDSIHGYDFHPDGRLVILRRVSPNGNQYRIQIEPVAGLHSFITIASFTAEPDVIFYRGLRVSPTGNDAVAEAVLKVPPFLAAITYRDARVHQFPLFDNGAALPDGENIGETDLFVYPGDARVNSPAFSPDGKHIMVTEGFSSGSAVFYQHYPDLDMVDAILLVPFTADNLSYVVTTGVKEQTMPPDAYSETIRPVLINQGGNISTAGFKPISGFSWVPAID